MADWDDDALADFDIDAAVAQHTAAKAASSHTLVPAPQPAPPPLAVDSPSLPIFSAAAAVGQRRVTSGPPDLAPSDLTTPLFKLFGHEQFRQGQEDAVRATLSGRDTCIYWPTGKGKSITYQLPALITERVTVVITPLISLMVDQCARLNNTVGAGGGPGREPLAIYLGPSQQDHAAAERALDGRGAKLIYCSPEKLVMGNLIERFERLHARGLLLSFAVDEAHCVRWASHAPRAPALILRAARQSPSACDGRGESGAWETTSPGELAASYARLPLRPTPLSPAARPD